MQHVQQEVVQQEQPPAPAISLLPGRKLTEPDNQFIRDIATAIRAGARPLTAAQWLGVSRKTWRAWRQRRGSPYDEMRDNVRAALAHLETKLQAELAKRSPGAALKGLRRVRDGDPEAESRPYHQHGLHSLKRALPHLVERVNDPTIAETDLSPVERAAREWRESVLADLGGRAHVSSTKLALLATTTGSWIILNSIDRYVLELASSEGLASRKHRRAWPIVEQRMRIADTLRAQLLALGLDRVSPPMMDLNTYLAERYGQNTDGKETT